MATPTPPAPLDDPNKPKLPGQLAAPTTPPAPSKAPQTPGINPSGPANGLEQTQAAPVNQLDAAQPVAPAANGLDGIQPVGTSPNAALAQVQGQFQSRFGRAMTPQEQQLLAQRVGYTGGEVTPEMLAQAGTMIAQYSGDINNPGGPAPTQPTQPVQEPGIQTGNLSDQMIQQLLNTGSTPAMSNIDPNNPAMVAQRAAFDRANAKATTRERLASSERAAARGELNTGGFDAGLSGIESNAGDRSANFESQLMKDELTGQRERVMQALQMAQQSGNAAQGRALQERLSQLDAAIRREGIGSQERLGRGQLSLGLLQALMGNQRAQDALGFNYAQLGQQGNQFDINTLLNATR